MADRSPLAPRADQPAPEHAAPSAGFSARTVSTAQPGWRAPAKRSRWLSPHRTAAAPVSAGASAPSILREQKPWKTAWPPTQLLRNQAFGEQ